MPAVPSPFLARWEITTAATSSSGPVEARLTLSDDDYFRGHYPGAPILPGLYLVEALVQAASAHLAGPSGARLDLREIVSCRFRAPLGRGDVVRARLEPVPGGGGPASDGTTEVVARAVTDRGEAAVMKLLLAPDGSTADEEVGPDDAAAGDLAWDEACRLGRLLDQAFVRRVLPHRHPLLLVDAAAVVEGPEAGRTSFLARKNITCNEPSYARLDGGPIASFRYPPSLIAESFCQACGLFLAAHGGSGPPPPGAEQIPVLARLAGFRFLRPVLPGDTVLHRVRRMAAMPGGAVLTGESRVDGRLVARVERVVAASAAAPPPPAAVG